MNTSHTVAVLGLGRMGAAFAARLASRGWDVIGWTRSGRPDSPVRTTGDPAEAVATADVVVLALFDGSACAEVVEATSASLRADAVVVNTATVSPAEASALAGLIGPSYVHAPVLGSVPAALAGTLGILAAARAAGPAPARTAPPSVPRPRPRRPPCRVRRRA
ncbi:NAD(P)-binding domain-containing protein, partial [Streptomyces sp. NPDC001478]